ncbi:hypothetical protein DAVIS_03866 [Mycobacterium marinum]|uniref:Uncharacterized protein n=1 Tax=Mycobacterium marinum TaxID=1781 RepID=A0A3E2MSF6_MYCMR|nr:hypothetical protein DAVIS_03866 [Mycobacterium marinum]
MGCHQRRRTRRVYRDRWSLQPQHISHPPRSHTGSPTSQGEALTTVRIAIPVALGISPDEHPGVRAFQSARVDPRVFQRFPTHFQQHPLLRIHRRCFARRDPEKLGIELRSARYEPAVTGVGLAHRVRIRVKPSRHIPAPIGGKGTHDIGRTAYQVPQTRSRLDAARQTTRHAHHCDRLVRIGFHGSSHRSWGSSSAELAN